RRRRAHRHLAGDVREDHCRRAEPDERLHDRQAEGQGRHGRCHEAPEAVLAASIAPVMGVEIAIVAPGKAHADAHAVTVAQPLDGVDDRLSGLAGTGELRGDRGEALLLRDNGTRLVAAGVGKREEVDRDALLAERTNRARDLANMPPNELYPETLAQQAAALADEHEHLTATALGPEEMDDLGMGALAAVGRGSRNEPRLVVLRYEPPQPTS